ncbi:MAG TPA: glutamine amidotransferase [Candidatus Saccharimonadales bacterium]|nr:glutamine amidotransferase [Candidatus Saccharimonadales bacterium]
MARTVSSKQTANSKQLNLRICHLYPELMDTYGDKGNIIAIQKRCEWRGIKTTVTPISIGDSLSTSHFDFDLFFFGGGQDKAQEVVGKDLQTKAKVLKQAIENNAVLLSICGGYQLLQNYFKTLDSVEIKGIGLFDAHTQGSTQRMIGNLLIEALVNYSTESSKLVGFENHSGKTFLSSKLQPLGSVVKGFGNNGEDQTEGAVYKNAFGCYLHGSLLPKNPQFADYLISKALERKYGTIKLEPLDDFIEWQAHKAAINKIRS